MSNNKNHTDLLLEDINSKFDAVLEAVGGMQDNVKKIPKIEVKVNNLESEMSAIRLATTETNRDVKDIKLNVNKIDKQLNEFEGRLIAVETAR